MILLLYFIIYPVFIVIASFLWIKMLRSNKTFREIIEEEKKKVSVLKQWNNNHKFDR